jgi:MerR family transcriptional regulator, light-induced transcriptional regulator
MEQLSDPGPDTKLAVGGTPPSAQGAASAYLRAVLDGDRRKAFEVVDRALDVGLDLGTVYLQVFQPTLREVGRLWQENRISVADEHLATAITQAAMVRLFERVFSWKPGGRRSLLAACVDTERHEMGLRMLCDLLELEGWDTSYLGASVPTDSLVAMIERKKPDAVALSVAIAPHLSGLSEVISTIRARLDDDAPLILVGGRPFLDDPDLALRLGADLTARDAAQAVDLLQKWAERE